MRRRRHVDPDAHRSSSLRRLVDTERKETVVSTRVQTKVGQFIWHDLLTTDVGRAQGFYSELFGWEIETWKPGEMDYPMIKANGEQHGGFGQLEGGESPHWVGHVAVEDVDEAASVAKREGGSIRGEPGGHPEVGRWATLIDPQGAVISAFSPNYDSSAPTGVFLWNELVTSDVGAAKLFYGAVFGWTPEDMDMGKAGTYTVFNRADGENASGAMERTDVPTAWYPYLAAGDVDASFAKAKKLSAQVFAEPFDVPTVGRVAVLADPTGATFGLYKPA
jgi:predicted enzyme related to lactoylglutathione lyase